MHSVGFLKQLSYLEGNIELESDALLRDLTSAVILALQPCIHVHNLKHR